MKPDYYDEFQCIADACSLTCCQEWKIAVDRKTAAAWKKQKRRKGSVRKDGPYLIIQKNAGMDESLRSMKKCAVRFWMRESSAGWF